MTILIFIIILGLLVFVHELGHFLFAKRAGVVVEEFGFGYPPRALILGRKWGTLFSLNWIPFGGFVKILGENYEVAKSLELKASSSKLQALSFPEVSRNWQAAILLAGIFFNILFAWVLFSFGFMIGVPASVENDFGGTVKNPALTIVTLLPGYPAEEAGLKSGDKIKNISPNDSGKTSVQVDRAGEILNFEIEPKDFEGKKIIGISMDEVGILTLPFHQAIWQGGKATLRLTYLTATGILGLIKNAVVGEANVDDISGPVGIVGLVGDATALGFSYLLTFTALISINLAIVNLVPFPALDGGRVLFVIIESITKRPINPHIAGHFNSVGFALLILLMLFITYHDIVKLF